MNVLDQVQSTKNKILKYKNCPTTDNSVECSKCKRFKVGGKRWYHCNGTDSNKKRLSTRQTSFLKQLFST